MAEIDYIDNILWCFTFL